MYKNPYQNLSGGTWFKANFHAHAGTGDRSKEEYEWAGCGVNPVARVVTLYEEANYDFLCISNHNLFTDTAPFNSARLSMIPGVEYTRGSHMLTIGVTESYHADDHQRAIKKTVEAGGFVVVCHPNWGKRGYWSWESLEELKGYVGLEVINSVIYRLKGSGLAADTWDYLLSKGRLVYGFGNDDFHKITDAARSFTLIYCGEKSIDHLKTAVMNGTFCASTGLYPDFLSLDGNLVTVKAKYPIPTYIETFSYRFYTGGGRLVSEQRTDVAEYRLTGEKYLRIEVMGENGAMLFFQPIYQEGALRMY